MNTLVLAFPLLFWGSRGTGRNYHIIDTVSLTWDAANDYCQATYGTTLATVVDAEDKAVLKAAQDLAGLSDGTRFFAGLTDKTSENYWVWEDGTTCTVTTGTGNAVEACIDYWDTDEPNDSGVEDCLELWFSGSTLLANDLSCDVTSFDRYPVCNQVCGNATSFVWEDLIEKGDDEPSIAYNLSVNDAALSLSIDVTVPYLGKTEADNNGKVYGTTYVLDFEDYDAHSDSIASPGTCQNREATDFASITDWDDIWAESIGLVDSTSYLAYAPSDDWALTISGDCKEVTYSATFTWDELTSCGNADSSKNYIATEDNEGNLTLSGTFYVNVVSPFDYLADYGFYRVYQLLSQPFRIVVSKTVYVVDSVGINLLTMDIVAVYKESEESVFKLVVLTESTEYLKLTRSGLTTSLFAYSPSSGSLAKGDFTVDQSAETDGAATAVNDCLANKGYICSQLWVIEATNAECGADSKWEDFSGSYTIDFVPECRTAADLGGDTAATELETYCTVDWLPNHMSEIENTPDSGQVILSSSLSWVDTVCDPLVFEVQFDADMSFFVDGYSTEAGDYELYQVGEDSVYVRITTEYPDTHLGVFSVELQNVWICTFDPTNQPDLSTFNPGQESGGCYSSDVDAVAADDYNPHIYDLSRGADQYQGFVLDDVTVLDSNVVQFQFDVPSKIVRDTVYIHAQLEVILTSGGQTIGRRLLNIKEASQINHFVDHIGVASGPKPKVPQQPQQPHHYPQEPQQPQQPYTPPQQPWVISLQSPWVIAIGALLALVLTLNVIFMCYVNCVGSGSGVVRFGKRRKYSHVKDADSEFYSERDAINVASA